MKITLRELKEIVASVVAEAIVDLPPREQVEGQIQSSRDDKMKVSKLLSSLEPKVPTASKLQFQGLSRAILAWQGGKVPWGTVSSALDRLYAGGQKKRPSYALGNRAA